MTLRSFEAMRQGELARARRRRWLRPHGVQGGGLRIERMHGMTVRELNR